MKMGRFEVELGALQAFTNDERTRSFLALEAATGTAEVRGRASDCRHERKGRANMSVYEPGMLGACTLSNAVVGVVFVVMCC